MIDYLWKMYSKNENPVVHWMFSVVSEQISLETNIIKPCNGCLVSSQNRNTADSTTML